MTGSRMRVRIALGGTLVPGLSRRWSSVVTPLVLAAGFLTACSSTTPTQPPTTSPPLPLGMTQPQYELVREVYAPLAPEVEEDPSGLYEFSSQNLGLLTKQLRAWNSVCAGSAEDLERFVETEIGDFQIDWIRTEQDVHQVDGADRLDWTRQAAEELCPTAPNAERVLSQVDRWKEESTQSDKDWTNQTLKKQHQERVTSIEPGRERVGRDVQPGTYVARGGKYCYWERTDRKGRTIDNDFTVYKTRVQTTIVDSDYMFYSRNCGRWRLAK